MASKTYFSEIDVIKGIAILTVVLEHSFAVKYVDLTGVQWCYHTVEIIKTFNMQLFFMVSGFLFANSKTDDLKRAYIGKVDRILIPMVFLTVINLVLVNALPSVINIEEETSVFQQIVNAVLYGESFWFLYTLFVLFCLLIPVKKYLTPKIVVAICLILVLLKELVDVKTSFLQLNHVLYMGAFFLLGYLSYGYYEKVRVWVSKLYIVIPLLLIYAFLYPLNNIACIHNWILPLSLDIAVVGGAILLVNWSPNQRVLTYLGKNSLQFYMFNGYALVPARILCAQVLKLREPFLLVSAVFIISLLILYILTEITRRIPVLSYLCGFGRTKK